MISPTVPVPYNGAFQLQTLSQSSLWLRHGRQSEDTSGVLQRVWSSSATRRRCFEIASKSRRREGGVVSKIDLTRNIAIEKVGRGAPFAKIWEEDVSRWNSSQTKRASKQPSETQPGNIVDTIKQLKSSALVEYLRFEYYLTIDLKLVVFLHIVIGGSFHLPWHIPTSASCEATKGNGIARWMPGLTTGCTSPAAKHPINPLEKTSNEFMSPDRRSLRAAQPSDRLLPGTANPSQPSSMNAWIHERCLFDTLSVHRLDLLQPCWSWWIWRFDTVRQNRILDRCEQIRRSIMARDVHNRGEYPWKLNVYPRRRCHEIVHQNSGSSRHRMFGKERSGMFANA